MKIYKNLIQGTDEWFKIKVGKFGSTDANTVSVNGKGLETACFDKAAEIITGEIPQGYTNENMERGIKLESSARLLYELKTGNSVQEVGFIEYSDFVGGSPDGLVGDDGILEVKCPTNRVFVQFLCDRKIKKDYFFQMQHLMFITDRKWCDYVVYNENLDRIEITRVERDEKAIEKIKVGLEAGEKKIKSILERVKNDK
jgi:predicted phage-related endonuclease